MLIAHCKQKPMNVRGVCAPGKSAVQYLSIGASNESQPAQVGLGLAINFLIS